MEESLPTENKISYDKSEKLGSGQFGTFVYKGSFESKPVAVKVINQDYLKTDAINEIGLLSKFQKKHVNIVEYFAVEVNPKKVIIALELCDMTLRNLVTKSQYNSFNRFEVLWQMTCGVAHLHSIGIIHRDLKPENILIQFGVDKLCVKIADFGLAKWVDNKNSFEKSSGFGTLGWIAPEALKSMEGLLPPGSKLTKAIDIFVLGILFYYVLSGGNHLFGEMRVMRDANILKPDHSEEKMKLTELQIREEMIAGNPSCRPTADEVLLTHTFFDNQKTVVSSLVRNTGGLCGDKVQKQLAMLRKIAAQNPKLIDTEDRDGVVPLLQPNVHPALVIELVKLGSDVGRWRSDKSTFLHSVPKYFTVQEYHELVTALDIRYLIPFSFSMQNGCPTSPLHIAVRHLEMAEETIALLHKRRLDFNSVDGGGSNILFCAVFGGRSLTFLQSLIQKGADPQHLGTTGNNILHYSAEFGNEDVITYFGKKYPQLVNQKCIYGLTPICYSLRRKSTVKEIVANLIKLGADAKQIPYRELLGMKCTDKWDVLKYLFRLGYFINEVDKYGRNLLQLAARDLQPNEFHQLVLVFVEVGRADKLTDVDKQGLSMLHWAVKYRDPLPGTLAVFAALGVNFNSRCSRRNGRRRTILDYAVANKRSTKCVRTLMELGANFAIANHFGCTAVHRAALGCCYETLELFLDKGANVNAKTKSGKRPLHYAVDEKAVSFDRLLTVELLINRGADINAKDVEGRTPLERAVESKLVDEETLELLRSREKVTA